MYNGRSAIEKRSILNESMSVNYELLLKLKQDKTELIIFAPKHRSQEFTGCQLEFDGSLVSDACFVKNLGVFFDKTLNMEKQGSSLAKSCFFQIRNIGRIRPYVSNDACKTLVSALDYEKCPVDWCKCKSNHEATTNTQHCCTTHYTNQKMWTHHTCSHGFTLASCLL